MKAVVPVLAVLLGSVTGERAARAEDLTVDVELVLAVDVSWSMDYDEQIIQREGYASAFRSEEVAEAIMMGGYGRVAVTYVEWAGDVSQSIVVPWTLIDSAEAAAAFADKLDRTSPRKMRRTSISGAIDFSSVQFEGNGYRGLRRVIDVSGDGPNNSGRPVTDARDKAVADRITINGLPLMTNDSLASRGFSIDYLDAYYSQCVIGGGLAFVIPVYSWEEFPAAVRRKLVLELAGLTPAAADPFPLIKAQAEPPEQVDCLIGEKIWEQRRWMWSDP